MPARLFVVHGSHPCAAVEKALELKGVPYKVFEWTPTVHVVGQQVVFGGRTVPGIRFEAEPVSASSFRVKATFPVARTNRGVTNPVARQPRNNMMTIATPATFALRCQRSRRMLVCRNSSTSANLSP